MPIISPEQREPSCQLPLHPGSCQGDGGQGARRHTVHKLRNPESHLCEVIPSGHGCTRTCPGEALEAWGVFRGLCISLYIVFWC